MRSKVWKFFWNSDKEEKWLDEMSARGLGLISYSWGRYEFEEIVRGKYQYRIELLNRLPSDPTSIAYLKFLEETGVDCVGSQMRWVYLRKKTSDGAFDLFSDLDSKLKHYTRIAQLWAFITAGNLIAFLLNLTLIIKWYINYETLVGTTLACAIASGIISICMCTLMITFLKKTKKLKREKIIHE